MPWYNEYKSKNIVLFNTHKRRYTSNRIQKNKREGCIMSTVFSSFTQRYPVSKTLRFSLIPQGKTLENIRRYGVVEEDEAKAEAYKTAKTVLDECHKLYSGMALASLSLDWGELAEALQLYLKDKSESNRKCLEGLKGAIRLKIKKHLISGEGYKELQPKLLIQAAKCKLFGKDYCGTYVDALSEEQLQALAFFDKFSTYFEGYRQNRENLYAAEGSTAIAFRLVEDNFPKFLSNIGIFSGLEDALLSEWQEQLASLLDGETLQQVFSVDFFNRLLTQNGIAWYNRLLGGVAEAGNSKLRGLNELCNLAYQQGLLERKVTFAPLFNQILADRETASFIPAAFESDRALLQAVAEYFERLFSDSVTVAFEGFITTLTVAAFDPTMVYVDKKQVAVLSNKLFDEWDRLRVALHDSGIREQSVYTLADLQQAVPEQDILSGYRQLLQSAYAELEKTAEALRPALSWQRIESYEGLKAYLDAIVALENLFKIFAAADSYEKDSSFYGDFDGVYAVLRENIPLYNAVRNYATKKPNSTEKFKLNFGNSTLADGWDQNKEFSNNAILLLRNGRYYLGIYNAKNKRRLEETDTPSDGAYQKMVYKLLPGPNKMLPKVFFSRKGIETFGCDEAILAGYEAGKHKKGDQFDLDFCHRLIDYFKEKIAIHPDWKTFGFVFSDTASYPDISAFYREVAEQGYKITYSYVSEQAVLQAINAGTLFVFEIYNKDFSEKSTGKANLHTLYWKQVFSEENRRHCIFRLNGGAELFYRPASIENPFVHKKEDILVRKTDVHQNPLDETVYQAILSLIAEGASLEELQTRFPTVSFRRAPHDIVKDKRYTKDAFAFHVPITLNCHAEGNILKMNEAVLLALEGDPAVNIIGIDRGERNLIYVSCIDQQGNILEQRHFNIINGTDYLQKLKQLARERDEARKNWTVIGRIKDMKEGYLSLVVHEIVEMMLRHNAILVLEDLNFGFKRGRFHIEQQVYQKFEKMLIEKLNYCASKEVAATAEGGIANAYQLTGKFTSFKEMGKQSGFLFYVPAAWTSKIDPTTGFVNLFTSEQLGYTNVTRAKAFFGRFRHIGYDAAEEHFVFSFVYSDFKLKTADPTDAWTVCTHGDRRISYSKQHGYMDVCVTEELKSLFTAHGLDYRSPELQQGLQTVTAADFWKRLLWLFKLTVTLRHENSEVDYILSPVKNSDGVFFDSRRATAGQPVDGDANGAYHIALQGLRLLKHRITGGKLVRDEHPKEDWLRFAQQKDYRL